MKYLLTLVLTLLGVVLWQQPVLAHVLIQDNSAHIGTVLHINPDDNPIAGETSELYFDIQDSQSDVRVPYDGYTLFITDESGNTTEVKTIAHDNTVLARYSFPTQGLYHLNLTYQAKYDQFQKASLQYDLRVERGVAGTGSVASHDTAQLLFILSVVALIGLGIIVYNNRQDIARQSSW